LVLPKLLKLALG
jgi:hypothetical protein